MKKIAFFLWLLLFLSLSLGVYFKGYDFVHSRSITLCFSCMGLGE